MADLRDGKVLIKCRIKTYTYISNQFFVIIFLDFTHSHSFAINNLYKFRFVDEDANIFSSIFFSKNNIIEMKIFITVLIFFFFFEEQPLKLPYNVYYLLSLISFTVNVLLSFIYFVYGVVR